MKLSIRAATVGRSARHDGPGEARSHRGALVRRNSMKRCFARSNGPKRVALIIEEEPGLQGFVIAQSGGRRMGDRKYCHRRAGAPAWAGHASAGRVSGSGQSTRARQRYFWKSANPTGRRGPSMRSGHFSKAGGADDTTEILKKTRFCIALILFDLHQMLVQTCSL